MISALMSPQGLAALARYGGFTFLVGGGVYAGANYLEAARYQALQADSARLGGISADTAANEDLLVPLMDLKALVSGRGSRIAYMRLVKAVNGIAAASMYMMMASFDPAMEVPDDYAAAMCRHHMNVAAATEALLESAGVPCGNYESKFLAEQAKGGLDLWAVTCGISLPLHARFRSFVEALLQACHACKSNVGVLWHDNLMAKMDVTSCTSMPEELYKEACGRMGVAMYT